MHLSPCFVPSGFGSKVKSVKPRVERGRTGERVSWKQGRRGTGDVGKKTWLTR